MSAPLDSDFPGWVDRLPAAWRPYALLARLDRPVGIWLLFLPCVIGLVFQSLPTTINFYHILWTLPFFVGAVAMRGAGCTWNDITDREIDANVERTRGRPLPSGQVSLREAYAFLGAQLFVGFLVWLMLPLDAKIVALIAVPLVIAYPYMKRLTWWPQAWLGATFNWGVLVAAATVASVNLESIILYIGLGLWTIAYDTTYALQDREDDALIGVRSTARLFGERALLGIFSFHLGAAALIALACALHGAGRFGAVTALGFLGHGIWQVAYLKLNGERAALRVFRSNVTAGAIVAAGILIAAMTPSPKKDSLYADSEVLVGNRADTYDLPFGWQVRKDRPGARVWFASDAVRALELEGIPIPRRRGERLDDDAVGEMPPPLR